MEQVAKSNQTAKWLICLMTSQGKRNGTKVQPVRKMESVAKVNKRRKIVETDTCKANTNGKQTEMKKSEGKLKLPATEVMLNKTIPVIDKEYLEANCRTVKNIRNMDLEQNENSQSNQDQIETINFEEDGQIIQMTVNQNEDNFSADEDSDSEDEIQLNNRPGQIETDGGDTESEGEIVDERDEGEIEPMDISMVEEMPSCSGYEKENEKNKTNSSNKTTRDKIDEIDVEMKKRLMELHGMMAAGGLKGATKFLEENFAVNKTSKRKKLVINSGKDKSLKKNGKTLKAENYQCGN